MKKKILFVITKSNWGGAQRYVFDLATNLPKENFDVAVALGGTGNKDARAGTLEKKLQEAGVRTIFVSSFMRDISLSKELGALRELFSLFKKEKPDVIHLNSSKAGGIGALAGRLAGVKKIIFTSHGLAWDENRNVLAKAGIYLLSRFTFLLCHKVITISQENHGRVHGSVLIYNGIGTMEFGSGERIRQSFPTGAKITGTIGELTQNKNQIALIKEAQHKPDMYVAIVGEGELRRELEEKIKEYGLDARVKLFGFVPANEALKGFDTFALPSKKEGLPYVLLEAKAAGLPIVANHVGGVAEILEKDLKEFSLDQMVEKTIAVYNS